MTKQALVDILSIDESGTPNVSWEYQDRAEIPQEIMESSEKLVKQEIIGRVVGEMFAVDGKSGNRRFYSRKLWENAIGKTRGMMGNGMMMGTIGHNQVIDEKAILEGKISHRVSRLWIDESTKKGMGEILIMNTDSGRNLNALLKSGVKFPVSSRAFGEFSGKTDEGFDIVNPDTYELTGFDFVINPGIASAIPSIVESLKNSENEMSDSALVTTLTEEKIQLNRQLTEANTVVETQRGRAELAESRLETATAQLAKFQALGKPEDLQGVVESFNEVNTTKLQLEGQVVAYKYLGTPEEIEEAISKSEAVLDQYKALGTPEEIGKCLEALDGYVSVGHMTQIQESQSIVEAYAALGTPQNVEEALDAATHTISIYRELGSPAEVDEALDVLERYMGLGTPAEIEEALTRSLAMVDSVKADRAKAKNETLAKELKVPVAVIESYAGKTDEEIRTLIQAIQSAATGGVSERYQAPAAKPSTAENLNENANKGSEKSSLNESRASRLADRFNQ